MQQDQDRKALFARFGTYEVDFARRELRSADSSLRLQEKPLAALALLIEKHGEIVTHDEFRRRLWPGNVIVEFDKNLATAVNKLRNALHDTAAEPKYIETIPRVGYRLIAPVEHVHDESPKNEAAAGAAAEQVLARPAQPPGRTGHRSQWVLAGGLVLVAAAMGVRLTLSPSTAGSTLPLAWQDSVVVGEFANSTGDAVFDGTLRQGLLSQLERSPNLNLVSDLRVAQVLALMQRPQDTPLALCEGRSVRDDEGTHNTKVDVPEIPTGDALYAPIEGEEDMVAATIFHYSPGHRWWYFPDMQPHEVIFIKLYDSDHSKAWRCPHTAFRDSTRPDAQLRRSMEFRALAYFSQR